jgi:hypothetical protein
MVTAADKAAECKNVLKRISTVRTELQHAAIKTVLQIEVVGEGHLHGLAAFDQENAWRNKLLIADDCWIIDERRVGECIGPGGMGAPELEVTHVVLDQPGGSRGGITPSKFSLRRRTGLHVPSWLTAREQSIGPERGSAVAATNSKQRTGCSRDGFNVRLGYVVIESAISFAPTSGAQRLSDALLKNAHIGQRLFRRHIG